MTSARRTYWHLESLRRKPSEYEIVTSRLLYHPTTGYEVKLPLQGWYDRHQKGSALTCRDWDAFRDPRETIYARYTAMQHARETFVDGLFRSIEGTDYDARLDPGWTAQLERILPPLRYPVHGLQMVAAYLGQLAPSSRIVIVCLFQAADEIRRVQRFAYRMRLLQETHPGFGAEAKAAWERDPAWQPLRELLERLLVTYDWGEAFVALNLVVKPMFDRLTMVHAAELAFRRGDDVLGRMLFSLDEDCRWHAAWSRELLRLVVADEPANDAAVQGWIERWRGPARAAATALAPLFDLPAGWEE